MSERVLYKASYYQFRGFKLIEYDHPGSVWLRSRTEKDYLPFNAVGYVMTKFSTSWIAYEDIYVGFGFVI